MTETLVAKASLKQMAVEIKMPDCSSRIEIWIDKHPRKAFGALTAMYFFVSLTLSSLKLLWLDELITLHIARLASVGAIWHALSQGADPNPPVTHILVHFSRMLFGEHEFALRLPAIVGYWIGLLSLFCYLRRHFTPIWALSGTVLSMTMAAFDYSFDSRSYAIFYGFTMLAFLCWSKTSSEDEDNSRKTISYFRLRIFALVGMTLALAAAISTNYFAVLAFLPIIAGELTHTIRSGWQILRQRKLSSGHGLSIWHAVDPFIWIGLAVAATPLLIYRPLIAHSIAEFAPYAWNKVSLNQVFDSYTQMIEIVLYPILGLFLFALLTALFAQLFRPLCAACQSHLRQQWWGKLIVNQGVRLTIPAEELVSIFFFLAYPFLGYIVAIVRGGMLSPRFVIPVCLGFAIAATAIVFKFFGHLPYAGLAFLSLCLAWFIARESVVGYWYAEQKQCFYKVLNHIPEAEQYVPVGSPIVISDPLMVLTFEHYASPDLVSRVVFPVDFPAIRLYRRDDSPEQNIWAGRGSIYHLAIMPVATLLHRADTCLVIASDGNWLLQDLERHHYPYKRLPINTRAVAIGGFTPLAHGTPVFYTFHGEQSVLDPETSEPRPIPFTVDDNLPNAKPLNP